MQLILTKKIQKKPSFYSCVPLRSKIMSLQLRILNLSKFLFQKCKSWDLTGNTFLCVSSILIDPQRHTVPPFKDKFIINNSFYKIEAIRVKLQSLDFKTGPSILFAPPCNIDNMWKALPEVGGGGLCEPQPPIYLGSRAHFC